MKVFLDISDNSGGQLMEQCKSWWVLNIWSATQTFGIQLKLKHTLEGSWKAILWIKEPFQESLQEMQCFNAGTLIGGSELPKM